MNSLFKIYNTFILSLQGSGIQKYRGIASVRLCKRCNKKKVFYKRNVYHQCNGCGFKTID